MPPSDYSNLNFHDRADRRRWKRICEEQRRIAQKWPCYDKEMALKVQDYYAALGPWRMRFYLAVPSLVPRAEWQGSVFLFEQVGHKQIIIAQGPLTGGKMDVPQDEFMQLKDWENEHWDQAKWILSEVFGDIIRPGDNSQRAVETRLPHVLLWTVPYEGPEDWVQEQH